MSPVREAGLTALREIRRNLGSAKGIAMFALFLFGGSVPSLLGLAVTRFLGKDPLAGLSTDERHQFVQALLQRGGYSEDAAKYLSTCPVDLYGLFQGTLIFAPLVILMIGFDQVSGDVQHRAIRYIAGRSRRESIVAGKALGVWAIVASLALVLNLVVWGLAAARYGDVGDVLSWGPRVWFFSVVAAGAWVGLTTLISSLYKTPIVALFAGVGIFVALWIVNKILGVFDSTRAVQWALPFRYEELLLSNEPLKVAGGIGAFIAWGAVMVAIAALIVKRRDV